MIRCAVCGYPLGHIDDACPKCLPGFYAAPKRAESERLRVAQKLVAAQAEDEGLWFVAQTAAEGYLQQELRRLHAAIEGKL